MVSSSLLAGCPAPALSTNSHCCTPTPRLGFLPFNVNCDWDQQPGGSLQPLGWAGLSTSCLQTQLPFLSAYWPAASARQREGTGRAAAGGRG